MAKKPRGLKSRAIPRGLAVSLAGIRAGGALAVDGAMQKLLRRDPDAEDSQFARREARRFVNELGKLKGTYVKIGQLMALFGEHFLPPVLAEAMRDLGDQTEPLPWAAVEPVLRAGLGARYAELQIEPEALAAASLAQVHVATVRASGERICLKVQYPGLAEVIDSDFDAVVRMLMMARWLQAGRDLDNWLESMRRHLHNEIDYRREAELTASMADLVAGVSASAVAYRVPRLYPRFCSDAVLALEYMEGVPVTAPPVAALPLARRNALAMGMLELFFYELYDWGCMQTDPNFGNYLLDLDDASGKRARDTLVLLDFGSILDCSDDFLYHLRSIIDAGLRQDVALLGDSLVGLGCLPAGCQPGGAPVIRRLLRAPGGAAAAAGRAARGIPERPGALLLGHLAPDAPGRQAGRGFGHQSPLHAAVPGVRADRPQAHRCIYFHRSARGRIQRLRDGGGPYQPLAGAANVVAKDKEGKDDRQRPYPPRGWAAWRGSRAWRGVWPAACWLKAPGNCGPAIA